MRDGVGELRSAVGGGRGVWYGRKRHVRWISKSDCV